MFVKYGAYRQLFSAALGLLLIIIAGKGFRFNAVTIITATVSGLALFGNLMCSQTVLKSGTMALNALFGTVGMPVPCIAGVFLFDAPMSAGQLIGVGLLIVSSYFLISSSSKIHTKFTFKTFLLLMGTMLSNGITMLMQQMFAHYVPDGDVSVFFAVFIWNCGGGSFASVISAEYEKVGRKQTVVEKAFVLWGNPFCGSIYY